MTRTPDCAPLRALIALALAWTTAAHAEPATSLSHIVFLWGIVGLGSTGAAVAPFVVKTFWMPHLKPWLVWVLSIAGFIVVGFVLGPLLVILGSILITGRTM